MAAPLPAGLRPLALLTLTWLGQPVTVAEELSSPPTEEAAPPQKLSARVHEALRQSLPKFSPPKPEAPPDTTPTTDDDVLVLAPIQVTPNKMLLDPFAFLSHKGRTELARKQNPGLVLGSGIGVEILTQEREYTKRRALSDELNHLATIDPAGLAKEIKLIRAATAQPNRDWATSVGQNRNPNTVTIRPAPYPPKKRR